MEDASLGDQQGDRPTLHGTRDVTDTAELHWSELARAHQDELKGRKRYINRIQVKFFFFLFLFLCYRFVW